MTDDAAHDNSQIIALSGGVVVSLQALQLALDLETRGIKLRIDDGTLVLNPRRLILDSEITLIRAHRDDLKVIAGYEAVPS